MSNAELIERLNKPCGRTTGHGESCSVGWLCGACADKAKAADALELADKRIAELECNDGGGCTLSGLGRGDCEHAVGLPGKSIPGQHDGQDDTVDAYGKPNGWCWSCWKSKRIAELEAELERERMRLVACGVVAMADTPDNAKEARKMHPDYESAACSDVARRVDECIELRSKLSVAREALRMIAGERQCPDLLMGNADIALEALAQIGGEDARS